MLPLPIDPLLPKVVRSLAETPRLVLEAPPGAGKTTRVPRALLDAGLGDRGEILVLEPRRLATRLAARRVAEELGEKLGERVGYRVRFEDVGSARTRVRFVTEGILTRRLVSEPSLPGVAAVVLDEFHERHLHGDVALALLRRLQATTRPDLRIVVMSATLDAGPIAAYLDAPVLRSEGRRFPVVTEHLPAADDRPLAAQVSSAVRRLFTEGPRGDVLVFLPGAAEIRKAMETCEKLAPTFDFDVLPLHGDLPPAEQDRAVRPGPRPKVILSTNVAESSVTIEGIVAVVDSGLARVASQNPWSGLASLTVQRVSRASAVQREGRAGRMREGRCLRLYTKADFETRPEHDAPEIQRLDLAPTRLELARAGVRDVQWLTPPRPETWSHAEELLVRLGALDEGGALTKLGERLVDYAIHPRLGRMLVEAEASGVVEDACVAAAILSEGTIRSSRTLRGPAGGGPTGRGAATERSDLVALVDLFLEAESLGLNASTFRRLDLDPGATLAVDRARRQLERAARPSARAGGGAHGSEDALLKAILAGFPDRVARRIRPQGRALAVAGGGSAELSEESVVRDAPWLVAAEAEERRGVVVRLASAIEPEWLIDLFPERIEERDEVRWNAQAERVEAVSRMTYDGLVLSESRGRGDPAEVTRVLVDAALARGAHTFAPEGALGRWLARCRFVHEATGRPSPPGDTEVRAALTAMCDGKRSFAELSGLSLIDVLDAELGAEDAARLRRFAPERVELASGRAARIEYEPGKPPWVESYLQDFFGTLETPRVAEGRVPLVVHLLAPNKRAVQVTTDLRGFWDRHYPAIRKELMRKYPKHFWPEDPAQAEARLRVPRRT